jgi:hypothetical protein
MKVSTSVRSLCVLLILAAAIPARSAPAEPDVGQLAHAKELYYKGVAGDEKSLQASAELLGEMANSSPTNPELMAYRGSIILLQAGRTWAVWRKWELSKQGIQMLDGAVERAPQNLEVRFVRAATTRHLPGFFQRSEQSKDDLRFLASRVPEAAKRDQMDPRIAAAALLFYAEDVARGDEQRATLQSAAQLAPESPAGKAAARKLVSEEK